MLLGNAPSSFYKYKYPKHWAEKQGAKGAKVFIYKVKYPLFFPPQCLNIFTFRDTYSIKLIKMLGSV